MFQTIVFLGFTHTGQKNQPKKSANRLTFLRWDVSMQNEESIGTFYGAFAFRKHKTVMLEDLLY